jgi:VIT1/CCC1 family predicted Fe2+/Mn2+ transporter
MMLSQLTPETTLVSQKCWRRGHCRRPAASSLSFALGGMIPLFASLLAPDGTRAVTIAPVSLVFLAALGALAARAGGAPVLRGAVRVLIWGAVVMGVTGAAGALLGLVV